MAAKRANAKQEANVRKADDKACVPNEHKVRTNSGADEDIPDQETKKEAVAFAKEQKEKAALNLADLHALEAEAAAASAAFKPSSATP